MAKAKSNFYDNGGDAIFGIFEGDSLNFNNVSLNGKQLHEGTKTVVIPSVLNGQRRITKKFTYFIIALHRDDQDYMSNDKRQVSLWINNQRFLDKEETNKTNGSAYYVEYDDPGTLGYKDGLFAIKIQSSLLPFPISNFKIEVTNGRDGDYNKTTTGYYDLASDLARKELYMSNRKIYGGDTLFLGQIDRRRTLTNNSLFGAYNGYSTSNDLNGDDTKKNFYFFDGKTFFVKGPVLKDFCNSDEGARTPGSIVLNNNSTFFYNVVSEKSKNNEYYYIMCFESEDFPQVITSAKLNFSIDNITFSYELVNCTRSQYFHSLPQCRVDPIIDKFVYRKIEERTENSFKVTTSFEGTVNIDKVLYDNSPFSNKLFCFSHLGSVDSTKEGTYFSPNAPEIQGQNYVFSFDIYDEITEKSATNSTIHYIKDGQGKFGILGTNLFTGRIDFLPLSEFYKCENTNIAPNILCTSTHTITKTKDGTNFEIPGDIVMPGETFVISNRKKFELSQVGKLIRSLLSGTYSYTYTRYGAPNSTTKVNTQQTANTNSHYPYIIHFGRKAVPRLNDPEPNDENKIIYFIKKNALIFSFEDNGSDRDDSNGGNIYVSKRLSNEGYFSFSRKSEQTDEYKGANGLYYTHERLKIVVSKQNAEGQTVTNFIYLQPTLNGTMETITYEGAEGNIPVVLVPLRKIITLLQENQVNHFDLSFIQNMLPAPGNQGTIRLILFYRYDFTQPTEQNALILFDITKDIEVDQIIPPLGLRNNGIIVNPFSNNPEDVGVGEAVKINLFLGNDNTSMPIQSTVYDDSNNLIRQAQLQFINDNNPANGKWYFKDAQYNQDGSSTVKSLCLSDLMSVDSNINKWKQYVIYDDNNDGQYGDSETTVKDKINGLWTDIQTNKSNISALQTQSGLISTNIGNLINTITSTRYHVVTRESDEINTNVDSIFAGQVEFEKSLNFGKIPVTDYGYIVGTKVTSGNTDYLFEKDDPLHIYSTTISTNTSGETIITCKGRYRQRTEGNRSAKFKIQGMLYYAMVTT